MIEKVVDEAVDRGRRCYVTVAIFTVLLYTVWKDMNHGTTQTVNIDNLKWLEVTEVSYNNVWMRNSHKHYWYYRPIFSHFSGVHHEKILDILDGKYQKYWIPYFWKMRPCLRDFSLNSIPMCKDILWKNNSLEWLIPVWSLYVSTLPPTPTVTSATCKVKRDTYPCDLFPLTSEQITFMQVDVYIFDCIVPINKLC